MAVQRELYESVEHNLPEKVLETLPLWQLDIAELTGHADPAGEHGGFHRRTPRLRKRFHPMVQVQAGGGK